MSLYDYQQSQRISGAKEDYSFAALIMAALRKADTFNADALQQTFPQTCEELLKRYNAPGGLLPDEVAELVENGKADVEQILGEKF